MNTSSSNFIPKNQISSYRGKTNNHTSRQPLLFDPLIIIFPPIFSRHSKSYRFSQLPSFLVTNAAMKNRFARTLCPSPAAIRTSLTFFPFSFPSSCGRFSTGERGREGIIFTVRLVAVGLFIISFGTVNKLFGYCRGRIFKWSQ